MAPRYPAQTLLATALLALVVGPAAAEEPRPDPEPPAGAFDPGTRHPDAPPETEQFGRLAGVWDVEMKIRREDGSWPETGTAAEWRFRYALDGWAIQDQWFSPPPDRPAGDAPRQRGTNLRIYDPEKGAWDTAWISNTQQKLSTFEARADGDDRMVMTGLHGSGRPSRTTFYDVTPSSFEWRLELQGMGEDPEAWTEVARIHAERRSGP